MLAALLAQAATSPSRRPRRAARDWWCKDCGTHNWATRSTCRGCKDTASSTGGSTGVSSSNAGASGPGSLSPCSPPSLPTEQQQVEAAIASLPKTEECTPAREALQKRLQQLVPAKPHMSQGSRLDQAAARMRRAESRLTKAEAALETAAREVDVAKRDKATAEAELHQLKSALTEQAQPVAQLPAVVGQLTAALESLQSELQGAAQKRRKTPTVPAEQVPIPDEPMRDADESPEQDPGAAPKAAMDLDRLRQALAKIDTLLPCVRRDVQAGGGSQTGTPDTAPAAPDTGTTRAGPPAPAAPTLPSSS